MWRANDVTRYGEGLKRLRHPEAGIIAFEYSAFTVDGRPDLAMVIYNPATSADADAVRSLVAPAPKPSRQRRLVAEWVAIVDEQHVDSRAPDPVQGALAHQWLGAEAARRRTPAPR